METKMAAAETKIKMNKTITDTLKTNKIRQKEELEALKREVEEHDRQTRLILARAPRTNTEPSCIEGDDPTSLAYYFCKRRSTPSLQRQQRQQGLTNRTMTAIRRTHSSNNEDSIGSATEKSITITITTSQ